MKQTVDSIIREITRRLVGNFDPRTIILFGSAARGAAGPSSDIDLIVLCDRVGDRHALEADMIAALRGVPIPIDLIVFTPEEFASESERPGTIAYPARREGRVVYDRAA